MPSPSSRLIEEAIQAFLTSEYDRSSQKEQKQLEQAIKDSNLSQIDEIEETLRGYKNKYSLEVWMKGAANKMAKQLTFGTHISKAIHSSSKGDSVNFDPKTSLPKGIIGHQSILDHRLDASGNAAALPLYTFFEFEVQDGKKIKDLIVEDNDDIKLLLSEDPELSKEYFNSFYDALVKASDQPVTSDYNKQTLWPIGQQKYICTVPLHPSSLTNAVFQKIQYLKYSDEMVQRRVNRYSNKEDVTQEAYATISDIAVVKFGGSNPQGVSRLMSTQKGINYLLPSMPPTFNRNNTYPKPSKYATTIFSDALERRVRRSLDILFDAVEAKANNIKSRNLRKQAADEVLMHLLDYAHYMQNEVPAGWSKEYSNLSMSEKLWLDPRRAEIEEGNGWHEKRETQDWRKDIIHSYARWLNTLLQSRFEKMKGDFADPEHAQWERDIEEMIKLYERAGKGVFV